MNPRQSTQLTAGTTALRDRILAAAEQLLDEAGPAGLSMREVARRIGVTHQAPYHHFPDRESILSELVTRGFQDMGVCLACANESLSDGSPVASAIASGEAYVGYALSHVYWAQVHGLAGLLLDGPLGLSLPRNVHRRALARQALTVFAHHMLKGADVD